MKTWTLCAAGCLTLVSILFGAGCGSAAEPTPGGGEGSTKTEPTSPSVEPESCGLVCTAKSWRCKTNGYCASDLVDCAENCPKQNGFIACSPSSQACQ